MIPQHELMQGSCFHPSAATTISIPSTEILEVGAIEWGGVRVINPKEAASPFFKNKHIHPVKITVEILLRCGFTDDGRGFMYKCSDELNHDGISYPRLFFNNRLDKWMDCYTRVTVDALHNLQMMYLVNTKKQLKFLK